MELPIDSLLNLPGTTVEGLTEVEGYICIQVKILAIGINCPYCQKHTQELHQNRFLLVRDLPAFGKPVYLRIPRRKFYCRQCQRYSTEKLEFMDRRQLQTKRYQENIYKRIKTASIEQIAQEEDLSPGEVQRIFNFVNQSQKKAWSPMKRLSIDEISIRKGAKKFKTVVGCIDTGTLVEFIDSHKQKEIIETLNQQPLEIREAVEEVSVDMWGGFPKVIKEVFPNAVIVIDRFHVMMQINKDLKKLCKKVGIKFQDGQYLLLKNSQDLEPEEKIKVQEILERSVCLQIAYDMKEEFRSIYENTKSVKSGYRRISKWLTQAQVFYTKAVPTLRTHLHGICNYFINRTTSGVMEGINNKIKLILRQAYGFSNFENLRSRLLVCFSD